MSVTRTGDVQGIKLLIYVSSAAKPVSFEALHSALAKQFVTKGWGSTVTIRIAKTCALQHVHELREIYDPACFYFQTIWNENEAVVVDVCDQDLVRSDSVQMAEEATA